MSLRVWSLVLLLACWGASEARARGMVIDSTYRLSAWRVSDTLFVAVHWGREEKDRIDVQVDLLDMSGEVHKTLRQKVKVGGKTGGQARFTIPSLQELELDSTACFLAVSANLSCNCEDLYRIVLLARPDSYTWPDPRLTVGIARHNKKAYVTLSTVQVATAVHLRLPPGHPRWRLEANDIDILPGQETEIEIIGLLQGEPLRPEEIEVDWRH